MKLRVFLLVAVVLLLRQNASADVFTVSDNLTDGTYMGQGRSLVGYFDFSSVLPTDGQYNAPYTIVSAYYTFNFQDDDSDSWTQSGQTTYPYTSTDGTYYYRDAIRFYQSERERVQVYTEGESSFGQTALVESEYYSHRELDSFSLSPPRYYFSDWYYHRRDYTGSVVITQSLGSSALDSLSDNGILDFALVPILGDIKYMGGQLTVEIEPNPIPTPLPGALLLGIIGLSAAGVRLRNHKSV